MEKILLILNATRPDQNSIEFATKIASASGSSLTGVFVENLLFEEQPADLNEQPSYFKGTEQLHSNSVRTDVDQAIRIFTSVCDHKGIDSESCIDKGDPVEEVVFESRFADLIIVDPAINFYNREDDMPSPYLKEILSHAECPVLLSAPGYEFAEEIILCYDGSASSAYAIRQFALLFKQFRSVPARLLQVKKGGKGNQLDEGEKRMLAWLRIHFYQVAYERLDGEDGEDLFTYLFLKQNRIIVMGAYGRSVLSNILRKSSADLLIRSLNLPLFITHH